MSNLPEWMNSRKEYIRQAVVRVSGEDANAGQQACGPALSLLLLNAFDANPGSDPREIAICMMKNMRHVMTKLKDELDSIDSVGKYA
jgi:hypothetical protein